MNKILFSGLMLSGSLMAQEKPNIIYILADDLGYGDLKCLNANSQIPTPNLDRLCAEGMHFTEVHSNSSVSTPTRYGILTGRYAFRSSLKKSVLWGYSRPLIEKERMTVANVLQKSGYQTAIFGKWHLGLGWTKKSDAKTVNTKKPDLTNANTTDFLAPLSDTPNDHGFDYSYIIPASLDMDPYVFIENRKVVNPNLKTVDGAKGARGDYWRKGLCSEDFVISQILDIISDKASNFISNYRSVNPFFVYLPLTAPHTPWLPAEKFKGKSGAGVYGDFVCHVDDVIGRILDAVAKSGKSENTLIIFASDNGSDWKPEDLKAFPKHQANYIFKGEKSDIWDGGHHVPFIVRWPNVVKKASVSRDLVCLTDFIGTCAEITGQKLEKNVGEDSFSILSILKGKPTAKTTRKDLIHHSIFGMFSLRQGDWKFVDGKGSGGWSAATDSLPGQLYYMKKDPSEKVNLYNKYPKKVEKLKQRLEEIKNME